MILSRPQREWLKTELDRAARTRPTFHNQDVFVDNDYVVKRLVRDGRECHRCGEWKHYTQFYLRKHENGREPYRGHTCHECEKAARRAWRLAHPERELETKKRYKERKMALRRAAGVQPRVVWSRDLIVDAFHRWEREFGCPPRSSDWSQKTGPGFPACSTVRKFFRSFDEAARAAGYDKEAA